MAAASMVTDLHADLSGALGSEPGGSGRLPGCRCHHGRVGLHGGAKLCSHTDEPVDVLVIGIRLSDIAECVGGDAACSTGRQRLPGQLSAELGLDLGLVVVQYRED